ncbi:MAG TPA: hypothetical protein PLD59_13180, partial [Tepidisphaeraceae bacterium]|nr:hypothetical protein [Tepidisphaeraceae bacterium]
MPHPISPRSRLLVPAGFAGLVLAMFIDVLFTSGSVLSSGDADLALHFAASRQFGFGELARGNLALWSPHMFSGYPYFGGFQPALLYPPNWIHLFLPLDRAINLTIILHTFAAGYFTYLWLRGLNLHALAAMTGGVGFMFCARFFLHIYAGHLPHLCLMPWVPLLLLAIDGLARRATLGYVLIGAAALSMMILAGYPQMVYYAAVVLPVYVVVRWIGSSRRGMTAVGLIAIALLALGMTAVQTLTARSAIAESTRAGGTGYGFATSFSFPPENLLTAIAPNVLGPMRQGNAPIGYFGQAYLWEVSTFIGATALLLAITGTMLGGREARLGLAVVLIAGTFGLGANTPLHRIAFDWLPGFSSFRGSSKFFFLVSLFMAHLAAVGLDVILKQRLRWFAPVAAGGLLVAVASLALWAHFSADRGIDSVLGRALVNMTERSIVFHDEYFPLSRWNEPGLLPSALQVMSRSLLIACLWLASAAALLIVAMRRPQLGACLLAALVTVELFIFARSNRPTTPLVTPSPQVWQDALAGLGPDQRLVRNPSSYPFAPGNAGFDAWGYDPGVLKRYAELMFAGQGFDPQGASSQLFFRFPTRPIFLLARIALVLEAMPAPAAYTTRLPHLPAAMLVPSVRVIPQRDEMFNALVSDGFDPAYTALIESPTPFEIRGRSPLPVEIKMIDTDTREISCEVVGSAMLLIGESYSAGWRASPISPPPAGQGDYTVMPANWAFLGIPLAAGKHHFVLEYVPAGYVLGWWITAGSVTAFAILAFRLARPR